MSNLSEAVEHTLQQLQIEARAELTQERIPKPSGNTRDARPLLVSHRDYRAHSVHSRDPGWRGGAPCGPPAAGSELQGHRPLPLLRHSGPKESPSMRPL
jgi:hypothetical protein